MHRSSSRARRGASHPRPRLLVRALATTLAITVAISPALATVHVVTVNPDGTFVPKYLNSANRDAVEWRGLRTTDAIARLSAPALQAVIAAGGPQFALDTAAVCATDGNPDDPAYVLPARAYRQPYEGANVNELTGPGRRGVSGIWALGPEGGSVSKLEIPSAEAEAIHPGITVADGCDALNDPAHDIEIVDDLLTVEVESGWIKYRYADAAITSGNVLPVAIPDPLTAPDNQVTDPAGVEHVLCVATTDECDAAGDNCEELEPDAARPDTIPPGTYLNGLLTSTYENPDVTGVVLRFNWKDLQYDDDGTIRERWQHLDRELERAISHGKLVTFDVRAGMFGTPDWIFTDYLTPGAEHAAPWCVTAPCTFADAPADAGQVAPLVFRDHYDEVPPGDACGSVIRIGSPGDAHYRGAYKQLLAELAAHLATDTRWWQAVAHVKVSGANLRTSEAELPHHCDDDYVATGEHVETPKDITGDASDRVLDVFKTLKNDGSKVTGACACNPKIWFDAGYVPAQLYDYYAEVEQQLVTSFFGEKSLGYQIIQDGFPRAKNDGAAGSHLGDHLYAEVLEPSSAVPASTPFRCGNGLPNAGEDCDDGDDPVAYADQTDGCRSDCTFSYDVNAGFAAGAVCAAPTLDPVTLMPLVDEDRAALTVDYCSGDPLLDPALPSYDLVLAPLADPAGTGIAAFPAAADDDPTNDVSPGDDQRYPGAFEQSVAVMAEAGSGRFTDPYVAGHSDAFSGKLFVPQHSGIQPYPQEGAALDYRTELTLAPCSQELPPLDTAVAGWPQVVIDAVGTTVADFPIDAAAQASPLSDPLTVGCPNKWIVDQGKDRELAPFTFGPPLPPITLAVYHPPQITGFQTTNNVRSIPHVESALMNLVYNTNGTFIELYEDALWLIGRSRGTGDTAIALDDPAAPIRLAAPGTSCDPAVTCYSKNLYQWSNELHLRRAAIAADWGRLFGVRVPALANPFPVRYRQTFVNTTGAPEYYPYVNPAHCDPALIDLTAANGVPSSLGAVRVRP